MKEGSVGRKWNRIELRNWAERMGWDGMGWDRRVREWGERNELWGLERECVKIQHWFADFDIRRMRIVWWVIYRGNFKIKIVCVFCWIVRQLILWLISLYCLTDLTMLCDVTVLRLLSCFFFLSWVVFPFFPYFFVTDIQYFVKSNH